MMNVLAFDSAYFSFFFLLFCEIQAGGSSGGDLEPAAGETTASEVVPLTASWDFLT